MPPPEAPPTVRSAYIRKSDIVKYGYAPHCKSCTALRLETPALGHRYECRMRILNERRTRIETRVCVERADKAREAKTARYIEHQDLRFRTTPVLDPSSIGC